MPSERDVQAIASAWEPSSPAGQEAAGDWAVVRAGGKQVKLRPGDVATLARSRYMAAAAEGPSRTFEIDGVLMLSKDGEFAIGTPVVPGARIRVQLLEEVRGPKVTSLVKRRRKNSRRKRGSRQILQPVRVLDISWEGERPVENPAQDAMPIKPPVSATEPADDLFWVLDHLRKGSRSGQAEALRRIEATDWRPRPAWERMEIARAVEPLLADAGATTRWQVSRAMFAVLRGRAAGSDAPAVGQALSSYFLRRSRRFFTEVQLRRREGPDGADGLESFEARVVLRRSVAIGHGAEVTLPPLPSGSRIEFTVAGSGVSAGSPRATLRSGLPESVAAEAVVGFQNFAALGDEAWLDVVADGFRVERRFLDLRGRGVRDPSASPVQPLPRPRDASRNAGDELTSLVGAA